MSQPDLTGIVFGLREVLPDSPAFDPLQPWVVNFGIRNSGTAPSGPFKVRLETFEKSAGFDWKVMSWCTQTFQLSKVTDFQLRPEAMVSSDWALPTGIPHTDFGSKFPFAFYIDPDDQVDESDDILNNAVVVLQSPPIIEQEAEPPPPPSPWKVGAWAVVGKRNAVVGAVRNRRVEKLPPATLELVLHIPKPGVPAGAPKVVAAAKIPSLGPGVEALLSLTAPQDFIAPHPGAVKADPKPSTTGSTVSKRGPVISNQPQVGDTGVNRTAGFKALVPFSLRIKEDGSEVGFGSASGPRPTGKIKFPQKT